MPTNGVATTLSLGAGAVVDTAGNTNSATASTGVTLAAGTPILAITPNGTITNAATALLTFAFSTPVTGFTATDIALTGATAGAFTTVDSSTYTLALTLHGGLATASVAAGAATAITGGLGNLVAQAAITSDRTAPTWTWSAPTVSKEATVAMRVTSSEDLSGLTAGDLTVANGTLVSFSGGPRVFDLVVDPTADGVVTVTVASGAAQDAAGNTTPASSGSFTADTVPPTLSITPTSSVFTGTSFTVSLAVTGRGSSATYLDSSLWSAVTVTNGTLSSPYFYAYDSGNGYATISATDVSQPVVVTFPAGLVTDAVGNPSVAVTREFARPATLTMSLPGGMTRTNASQVSIQLVFSRAITGLLESEFSTTKATITSLTGSGTTWTVVVQPTSDGTVTIGLPSNQVDQGNESATVSFTSDRTGPVIDVSPLGGAVTATSQFVSFSWSSDGAGATLTPGQLTVNNATITGWSFIPSASTSNGNFTLQALDSSEGYGVVFPAGVIQDQAGNGNAEVSRQWVVDAVPPTASITPGNGVSFAADTPFTATLTFSEPMFTNGMEPLTATSLWNGVTVYGATITSMGLEGTVGTIGLEPLPGSAFITLSFSGFRDAAGRSMSGTTTVSYPVDDGELPVLDSVYPLPGSTITQDEAGTLHLFFSEGVKPVGTDLAGLTMAGGTLTEASWQGSELYVSYEPVGDGPLTLSIAAGTAVDGVGNPLPAVTLDWTLDATPPQLTVTFTGTYPTWTATITANETARFLSYDYVSPSPDYVSPGLYDGPVSPVQTTDLRFEYLEVRGGLSGVVTTVSPTQWTLPVWAFPQAGILELRLRQGVAVQDAEGNRSLFVHAEALGSIAVPPDQGTGGGTGGGGLGIGSIGTTATASGTTVPMLLPYQGRLTLDGAPAQGPVSLKFALVDAQGTVRWSHDGSTGEPATSLSVTAVDGSVSAYLGDVAAGQQAIPPSLFRTPDLRIRVWVVPAQGDAVLVTPDLRLGASGYAAISALVGPNGVDSQALQDGTVAVPDVAPVGSP